MSQVAVFDHVRLPHVDCPDGVYRVVGTSEETVTLLRVADADCRRAHTGELVTVDFDDLEETESVPNPDGNRSLVASIAGALEMGYWSVRVFGQQLAANPVLAAVAGVLFLAGTVGERFVAAPDVAFVVLVLAGGLLLAAIGSGRL